MVIHSIPEVLGGSGTAPVQVVDYHSTQELQREKVNLQQHTISFLREGTKEVYAGDHPVTISPTHFLVMKAGHCLMTEKLSSEHQRYQSVLLFFSEEALAEIAARHFHQPGPPRPVAYVEAIPYDRYLETFVQSLLDLQGFDPAARTQLLRVKLEELLLYFRNTHGDDLLRFLLDTPDDRHQRFVRVVEHNRLDKLSLEELAFLANMSVSTFKREFRKHFGTSPSKWFLDQRLERAAYLLSHGGKRPSDIYEAAGYENLSNFIQAFKGKFGVTPKQFQLAQD